MMHGSVPEVSFQQSTLTPSETTVRRFFGLQSMHHVQRTVSNGLSMLRMVSRAIESSWRKPWHSSHIHTFNCYKSSRGMCSCLSSPFLSLKPLPSIMYYLEPFIRGAEPRNLKMSARFFKERWIDTKPL